ncbi:MAG: two-component system sensor histidine kinase NtrB [Parachlamydiaceae bacterium]
MSHRPFTPLYLNPNPKGVIFIDLDGTITTYNETAEKLLNVPRKKVLNQPYWNLFDDEFLGFSMKKALSDKIADTGKQIILTERPLEIDAAFVALTTLSSKTTEGLIILINDISEIKRRQAIIARNERMKELSKMASLAAHEIRNPLGGIRGFASLLQRDLQNNTKLNQLATYIIEGTENLNHIVEQILGYTKPLHLNLESHNLVEILENLILHLQADEGIDPRITIDLEFSQNPIKAIVDPESLKSALLNLAYNAIHAMPDGGKLHLSVSDSAWDAMIKVSDTGVGIPKENLPKMFSPYFTTRADGHGFGLAEVHKIVHEHHGEIEFSSTVGEGTTFVIHLPKVHS